MSPQRIQRKCTKGWRTPEGAMFVGRPTRWGNPFRVGDFYATRTWAHRRPQPLPVSYSRAPGEYVRLTVDLVPWTETIAVVRDRAHAVDLFRAYIDYEDIDWAREHIRRELAGKDLVCWCDPFDPCHVDVLLKIANGGEL